MARLEVHNAIVTRNTDPDEGTNLRGAVFFDAPTLFNGEFPLPAIPCYQYASAEGAGLFFVPQVDDEIEVLIQTDDGTFDTSDVELPEPRWRCMIYSEAADIAEEFKTNYTKRMGWKTNSGHILLFDDTEGEELLRLAHKVGNKLEWDFKGNEIKEVVKDVTETIGGMVERTITGNLMETLKADVTRDVMGKVTESIMGDLSKSINGMAEFVAGGGFVVDSSDIKLGSSGASEPAVLGNALQSLWNSMQSAFASHQHVGNLGAPTSPPTAAMPPFTPGELATKVKVE